MIKINFKPEHFTEVFPPHIKPVRPGWYSIGFPSQVDPENFFRRYAFYDGKEWGWTCKDPNGPCGPSLLWTGPGPTQAKYWSGLNFDPNALHL